ncbi:hypothetical protein BH09PSE6_BH09PSE6_04450 [soil metagenome]
MRIRSRLLLLVLAVWIPSVGGLGLLSRTLYVHQEQADHDELKHIASSLAASVRRELETRAAVSQTLAASAALRAGRLDAFYQEAQRAVEGSGSWAVLVDPQRILLNTRWPLDSIGRARPAGAPELVKESTHAFFLAADRTHQQPAMFVMAPVKRESGAPLNVSIGFAPDVIQSVIANTQASADLNVSVLDQNYVVVARNEDPGKWVGTDASGLVREKVESGATGLMRLNRLDGTPSLAYLQPIGASGWTLVTTLPEQHFAIAARRVTISAALAAIGLLLVGLTLAAYAARHIVRPMRSLQRAALDLERDRIPARLATGLAEVDVVGHALHRAGVRSSDSTALLEQRVADAVEIARIAQEKSFENQKHEAIGRLTGGLAHDFNNLLQTISMGLQMLGKSAKEGRERRIVDAALQACGKGSQLVRHMLAFGRTQSLQPHPTSLRDFVLRVRELAGKAVGERITLTVDIQGELLPVLVDPTQMELALLNLVFNARDAMSEGGTITLIGRAATRVDVADGLDASGFACLEVIDEGHGMDPQTLARVLEPYFTTKPVGRGSGLGLAQVNTFAQQTGGELRLRSTPGRGTRITLTLPTCAPAAPEATAPVAVSVERAFDVLMVEYDVLVSSVVVTALQASGHRVALCSTADEALIQLLGTRHWDVVFTDVVMPGEMSGLDLAHWCRAHRPELAVVVATGYTTQLAHPDIRVVKKPYALDDVLLALDEVVRNTDVETAPAEPIESSHGATIA